MSEPSTRSGEFRVAIPLQQPIPRQSLIPADVMASYQREVDLAEREESQSDVLEVASTPIELPEDTPDEFASAELFTGLAATTAADPEVAAYALEQVALFHELSRASLDALLADARQGEVQDGEYLFSEGDAADSFFVVIDGSFEIVRKRDDREVALRHMGRGEAIGLFGLFSGRLRAASARAIGDAVVLEVPCASLELVVRNDDVLHDRLIRFYQERLLEGFLGSSKLFTDVDSIARARLIGRFYERLVRADATLVQPGEVANLLAVIISGKLILELKPKTGGEPKLFELLPGQFVAVTSAFSGLPCRMRIYAAEDATLAMLGHREMADLLKDYPALRAMNARLPTLARTVDRDVYCGHTGVPGL